MLLQSSKYITCLPFPVHKSDIADTASWMLALFHGGVSLAVRFDVEFLSGCYSKPIIPEGNQNVSFKYHKPGIIQA